MNDSDDSYFSDDFVLDDKILAVLDEEESKFRRTANTQSQQVASGPPAKRQKTTGSWRPQSVGSSLHRADTLEDMEDYPDVSIGQDGTYDLRDKQRRPSGPPSRQAITPRQNPYSQEGYGTRPSAAAPLSRGSAPPKYGASVGGPMRASQASSRPSSVARGTRPTQSPASPQEVSRTQSGPPQRVNRVPSTTVSTSYVTQLLQQIEELRNENQVIRANMESALEAKFAKEGEVTILRKRLEKTAQDHLTQIVKLKAAKDEADAKHVVLQKQHEADKERLRTELTFRRHELETTSWKRTAASSPRRDVSQAAETLSFQWQRSDQRSSAGPSRIVPETPRRPRFGVISDFEKPKKSAPPETRDLPPGFETGPPRNSQFTAGHKGKEVNPFSAPDTSPVIPSAIPLPQASLSRFLQSEVFCTQIDGGGPADDFIAPADHSIDDIDVHMVDDGTPVMAFSSQEDTTVMTLSNWNLVLHDIMLTHTLQGSKLPTLQLLVSVSPADTSPVQSYGAVLMRIFDALGGIPAHPDRDFDHFAQIICCALCETTELLAKNNLISPLTAVLNLLTNLAYMLPPIHALLLSQRAPDHKTPQLLGVVHNIIQDQLQKLDAAIGNEPPELCSLGKETLSLYEALVWRIPDDLEDCTCLIMPSLLTTLLHPRRPLWFLIESMRVLLWLSTRRNLFRSLLSHQSTSEQPGSNGELADHVIGLVCSLLTDTDRQGPETDELKSLIIMFFGMLSNAHPDAYTLLVESQELIPSIVRYVCRLAAPIWDEDRVIFSDPQATTRAIHMISHTTLLLHHLVIGEDATLDLRERLLHAPPKTYQGLIHGFILTFGRLGYASPPYWLDEKNRVRLAGVADIARALLERVIEGPELDLIWETYQDEGEDNDAAMDVDDEEVEAQKFANDSL